MVEIPAPVRRRVTQDTTGAGARYVEELANFGISKGWEYVRLETIFAGSYYGAPAGNFSEVSQFLTFRRPLPEPKPAPEKPPEFELEIPHIDLGASSEPNHLVEEEPADQPPLEEKPWWR